jgi:hypothetical protein
MARNLGRLRWVTPVHPSTPLTKILTGNAFADVIFDVKQLHYLKAACDVDIELQLDEKREIDPNNHIAEGEILRIYPHGWYLLRLKMISFRCSSVNHHL